MKKVIYLYKSGQLLCKDYSLILKDKKDYVSYIPIEQIDTLICFGEISINKRTLSLLNKHNIVILFFNFYGQYIGRFTPKQYLDGKILINQIHIFENETIRYHIARTMIISSLKNCLALLKYYNKKQFPLLDNIIEIESILVPIFDKECIICGSSIEKGAQAPSTTFSPLYRTEILCNSTVFSSSSSIFASLNGFNSFIFFLLCRLPYGCLDTDSTFSGEIYTNQDQCNHNYNSRYCIYKFNTENSFYKNNRVNDDTDGTEYVKSCTGKVKFVLLPGIRIFLRKT